MKKQILAIIQNETKKTQIADLCKSFGIELIEAYSKDINKSLGELLGMPLLKPIDHPLINTKNPAPAMFAVPDLMMFNNMSDADLERFIDEYNARHIEPTKYKGTVTPSNLTWSLYEIIKEYEEEAQL